MKQTIYRGNIKEITYSRAETQSKSRLQGGDGFVCVRAGACSRAETQNKKTGDFLVTCSCFNCGATGFELRSSRADTLQAQGEAQALDSLISAQPILSKQCRKCKSRLRRRRWFCLCEGGSLLTCRDTKKQVTFQSPALALTVVPPGFEPGTQGFSVLCSTN